MKETSQHGNIQKTIYIWLSIALLMPVFLLPLRLAYGEGAPAFGVDIESRWVLLASCLLLVAVTSDVVLRLIDSPNNTNSISQWSMYAAALWILVVCTVIPYIVIQPLLVWYLAGLFLVHAGSTGFSLWCGDDGWWLWCAWWRDIICSLTLLVWPAYWP